MFNPIKIPVKVCKLFRYASKTKSKLMCIKQFNIRNVSFTTNFNNAEDIKFQHPQTNLQPFYALGVNIGNQVQLDMVDLLSTEEITSLIEGFTHVLDLSIDKDQIKQVLHQNADQLATIMDKRRLQRYNDEMRKGEDFIADFIKHNPDAIVTSSGLVYKVCSNILLFIYTYRGYSTLRAVDIYMC
jgi:hypothetical protein